MTFIPKIRQSYLEFFFLFSFFFCFFFLFLFLFVEFLCGYIVYVQACSNFMRGSSFMSVLSDVCATVCLLCFCSSKYIKKNSSNLTSSLRDQNSFLRHLLRIKKISIAVGLLHFFVRAMWCISNSYNKIKDYLFIINRIHNLR